MKEGYNKTKILATLGPASSTLKQIKSLVRAGANVFRVNFSHGTHEEHLKRINIIKELNKNLDFPVGILMDLQGPKIRIGDIDGGAIKLEVGQKLNITTDPIIGNGDTVSTTYNNLPKDVNKGDIILIDDGNIDIKVLDKNEKVVFGQVLHGGFLKSRKGINLPDTNVSIPSLTEKDRLDLEFGLEQDVDWVALSFVRQAKDILELRKIIKEKDKFSKIVAKIEKPEAVINIDDIIEATDAVMVARGDLGVEIPMEEVPVTQKMLIRKCNQNAKPVIVATQMLESMIANPRPTRAEASDVANAILDGADAIMLSAETAAGSYPAQAVRSMSKIIRSVESNVPGIFTRTFKQDTESPTFLHDRVLISACNLANDTNAKVITGMTASGYTAYNLARQRPKADIYIFAGSRQLLTQGALIWGVRSFFYERFESTDDAIFDIQTKLLEMGIISEGDVYITTGTFPVVSGKRTNTVRLNVV